MTTHRPTTYNGMAPQDHLYKTEDLELGPGKWVRDGWVWRYEPEQIEPVETRPKRDASKHICVKCERQRPNNGRGLCKNCYKRAAAEGTINQYPRRNRRRDELVGEYELLAQQGQDRKQIADRLGVKRDTLDAAIARAKQAERKAA